MKTLLRTFLSRRTRSALRFDYLRFKARLKHQLAKQKTPPHPRLHFGCGTRHIPNWTNVDVVGSPFDIDLAAALPWRDSVFDFIVSQQVIEHLDMESEIIPLFAELARVSRDGAEIWLSCPDLEKVCRGYIQDGGAALLADRRTRLDFSWAENMPESQIVNVLFHQGNEHKNLYDFALLKWLLEGAGFAGVRRTSEPEFRSRFSEFPLRNDDYVALYVTARRAR